MPIIWTQDVPGIKISLGDEAGNKEQSHLLGRRMRDKVMRVPS